MGMNRQQTGKRHSSKPLSDEYLFIDGTIPDRHHFIHNLLPGVQVVILDPSRDGIAQIGETLQGRFAVSALHIVAHGEAGTLQLGATRLTHDTIHPYAPSLSQWSQALAPNAELLIYGCNVARGKEGESLVKGLSQLTGATTAASTTPVGSQALGGRWQLDYATGPVTRTAFNPKVATWPHLLVIAASLDLSTLDGTNGFRLDGVATYDYSGFWVSGAGDVNGDGLADIMVGASGASNYAGATYVIFGQSSAFNATLALSTLDGVIGFRLDGVGSNDYSGEALSCAGDINGDGFDDLIIGATGADPSGTKSGSTYVVFGKDSSFGASMGLSTLDGSNGFRLNGKGNYANCGVSVDSAGDINGDGFDDLIVGAFGNNWNSGAPGATYVVFGKASGFSASLDLTTLNGNNGFRLDGAASGDWSGFSVSRAGDVNGDGLDDLLIGANNADPGGNMSGASYVVFGKTSGFSSSMNLSTLNGSNGFRIEGEAADDNLGSFVNNAGDINGDGLDDLIIGASLADPNGGWSGASYVVFGKSSGFSSSLNLGTLDGTNGFQLNGEADGERSGIAVNTAGDFNGDGFNDLIIGAAGSYDTDITGACYVVYGKASGFAGSLDLSTLDGTNGFKINGVAIDDYCGQSVSCAGDINGDGYDDLIIGANQSDVGGDKSGASYVVFGGNFNNSSSASVTSTGTVGVDIFLGGVGDDSLLGNGGRDVLIGGAGDDLLGISDNDIGRLNGGGGSDRLTFYGNGLALDLTATGMSNRIEGIEQFDLQIASGSHSLTMGSNAISLITPVTQDLRVMGDGDDTLILVDDWNEDQTEDTINGQLYGRYTRDGVEILVDRDVIVTAQSASNLTLTTSMDNLLLTGSGKINGTGNSRANTLTGNGGDNLLNGGAGADDMIGGGGDDTFVVDDAGDGVTEGAGGGTDLVRSSITWTLAANVENLTLTGSSTIDGTGNGLANTLTGNSATNRLTGLAGDDIYVVNNSSDVVIEAPGQGTDRVQSSVTWTLAANVENLTLTGSTAIQGTGNALANTLTGNSGANRLSGGDGRDLLVGGAGADRLTGGAAADTFKFNRRTEGGDVITDFSASQGDKLSFVSTNFGSLSLGTLTSTRFVANSSGVATSSSHRFVFNTSSRILYYDADGKGGAAATAMATLNTSTLRNSDILISSS